MTDKRHLRFTAFTRISIVFIFANMIWIFINLLNTYVSDGEYDRFSHFMMGLSITTLTILLLVISCRIENSSWFELGMANFKSNLYAFLFGLIIWLLPASIGTLILVSLNMIEIAVISSWKEIFIHCFILSFTVFLIEALPEELIFRGYIFSKLQKMFKNNLVILLQMLLFTIFGFIIGSIYSVEQFLFIPGFAFILGYFRAKAQNIWLPIGFHLAIMTVTQLLNTIHKHLEVDNFFTLQFAAFILLPSTTGAILLNMEWIKRRILPLVNS
ncbi:CPBP family intramembrane glutamic endopeptidase [Gracilibacillus xinjiangensis]|uniref:CPBP family intramembrane glutamic endopeptidase n=1 Tax=Gracilibacillus xinjiangensis TaxID=1193282 RepID=A0ABV8WP88_9BACI